jgi:hypothetical protein
MITDEDVELFDILSSCYRNFALISDLTSKLLIEAELGNLSNASHFYHQWCEYRMEGKHELPLNYGTILMLSWAVIVNTKERWLNFLPDTPVEESDLKWGLLESKLKFTSKNNPSVKDVIERVRNSISHADFKVNIKNVNVSYKRLLSETTYTFEDGKKRDFKLEISMKNMSCLLNEMYLAILEPIQEYMDRKEK